MTPVWLETIMFIMHLYPLRSKYVICNSWEEQIVRIYSEAKNIWPIKRNNSSHPKREMVATLPLIEFLNCLISNSCCWSLLSRWSSRLIIAAGSFSNKRLLFDIRTLLTKHKHNRIKRCSSIVDLELYSVTLSYLLVITDK